MTTIVTRAGKGLPLSIAEMDANLTNLNNDKAELANPAFTGNPTAPTPTQGDNDTSIATTAFVNAEIAADRPYSDTNPIMDSTAAQGSSPRVSRQDHVHPSDTTKVNKSGDTLTGPLWAAQGQSFGTWLSTVSNSSGVLVYRSDKSSLAGGAGVHSTSGTSETYAFLGSGSTPWVTGIYVYPSGGLTAGYGLTIKDKATGSNDGNVVSGTYTPTFSNYVNVSTSGISGVWSYIRVGNIVTVTGQLSITPTSGSVLTSFYITLPITSAFSSTNQCGGHVNARNSGGRVVGDVVGDASGDRAWASYIQVANTNLMDVVVSFMYQVI